LAAAAIAVLGVIVVTLIQLHPNLLVSGSLTTGGDTGAHVATPAFLRDTLLPQGQLTGWYPGWFNGFPVYTYYFVLPDLIAALLSYVISYAVAFKMATILGSILMPICAYGLGRLFRLRDPIPAGLAIAMLPFLFDSTFTIDGGNLFSSLAGEYAFSLSLALSFVVIGLFARGVQRGSFALVTPLVMAACLASHLVPFLYALVGMGTVTLVAMLPRRYLRGDDAQGIAAGLLGSDLLPRTAALLWALRTAILGFALSAWWLIPFGFGQRYTNSMGYVNDTQFIEKLFPRGDLWILALAVVGAVVAIKKASRFGIIFVAQALIWGLVFRFEPQGSLWNERILPLWYVSLYLLAGYAVGVVAGELARFLRQRRLVAMLRRAHDGELVVRPRDARWLPGAVGGPLMILILGLVAVVPPLSPQVVPVAWLNDLGIHPGANEVSAWANWNYSGYQAKPAWPEYHRLMSTMAAIGAKDGCGRAMWEYNPSLNRFGTPESLMLLPYWTNNCIGSQEGLFFESSPTVPYHFLIQSEVSVEPSEPQAGLPYAGLNLKLGVAHLRMLGVRYLMTSSPSVTTQADGLGGLTKLTSIGPFPGEGSGVTSTTWSIYLIRASPTVVGLTHLPVVVPGIDASVQSWQDANVSWFLNPKRWAVPLAASGPTTWPRGSDTTASSPRVRRATVSHVVTGLSSISFHVERLGTPVEVKTSYFPRWHVSGAEGPYRISPNLMVVVPTSHDVTLSYGTDPTQVAGIVVSTVAMLALVVLGVIGYRRRHGEREA